MRTRRYRKLIDAAAQLVGLPAWEGLAGGIWLEGLVLTESGGDPQATRYEAHQDRAGRRDSATDADTPGVDDGLLEDDRSYGLTQVMGYNIRRLCGVPPGTPMRFGWACLPMTNIALGLRVLSDELRATGGDVARALARYNGGPTGDARVEGPHGPEMRRQVYVRQVALNAERSARDREQ